MDSQQFGKNMGKAREAEHNQKAGKTRKIGQKRRRSSSSDSSQSDKQDQDYQKQEQPYPRNLQLERDYYYIQPDPCQWVSDGDYQSEEDKSFFGDIGQESVEERYKSLEDSPYFQQILNGEIIDETKINGGMEIGGAQRSPQVEQAVERL